MESLGKGQRMVGEKLMKLRKKRGMSQQEVASALGVTRQTVSNWGLSLIHIYLVTNSGSGFDPHISPAAAEYQVDRLARTTGKSASEIRDIIKQCTEQPQFGFLGDARVNVLKVNLMLDGVL